MFFSRLGESRKIVLRFSADVCGVAKRCFLRGQKQLLDHAQTHIDDVFLDGRAVGFREFFAQIVGTQIDLLGQSFDINALGEMLIDIVLDEGYFLGRDDIAAAGNGILTAQQFQNIKKCSIRRDASLGFNGIIARQEFHFDLRADGAAVRDPLQYAHNVLVITVEMDGIAMELACGEALLPGLGKNDLILGMDVGFSIDVGCAIAPGVDL